MRHPGKRRNTRLIAVVMLLLWMFVLGSGIAHACLSDAGHRGAAVQAHQTGVPSVPAITGAVVQGDHAGQMAHSAFGDRADCSHVHATDCDAVTAVAPAPSTGQPLGKLDHPGLDGAAIDWLAFAVPVERKRTSHRHRSPDSDSLPVYLRFLRLTL